MAKFRRNKGRGMPRVTTPLRGEELIPFTTDDLPPRRQPGELSQPPARASQPASDRSASVSRPNYLLLWVAARHARRSA
jgi:hypothetical protein